MEKVTGVPGEHITREQTLDGVEQIIGRVRPSTAEKPDDTNDSRAPEAVAKSGSD